MAMAGSQPQRRNSPTQGAAMLALSALFFALMGGLIREASSTVNNETVVFFRNLVGVLFFLPLALTRGIGPLRTRRPLSHLLRTTYGLGGMYCYFYALAHLPLTDAMLFSYAAPVFTPLIAHLWIKEPLTRRMMVATLVGFLGVLLVARPSGAVVAPIALVGIASSLMAACAFVSIREMSDSEPAYRIVFYFALFGTLFSAVPLAWAWQPLNGQELLLLLGAGLFASLGQLTMSQAYALASPGVIGPIAYMAIVFAGVIAWLRWDELPSHTSLLGAALIFAASLIPLLGNRPAERPAECPTGAHLSCMICAPFSLTSSHENVSCSFPRSPRYPPSMAAMPAKPAACVRSSANTA